VKSGIHQGKKKTQDLRLGDDDACALSVAVARFSSVFVLYFSPFYLFLFVCILDVFEHLDGAEAGCNYFLHDSKT
jgi:hypothetical protein